MPSAKLSWAPVRTHPEVEVLERARRVARPGAGRWPPRSRCRSRPGTGSESAMSTSSGTWTISTTVGTNWSGGQHVALDPGDAQRRAGHDGADRPEERGQRGTSGRRRPKTKPRAGGVVVRDEHERARACRRPRSDTTFWDARRPVSRRSEVEGARWRRPAIETSASAAMAVPGHGLARPRARCPRSASAACRAWVRCQAGKTLIGSHGRVAARARAGDPPGGRAARRSASLPATRPAKADQLPRCRVLRPPGTASCPSPPPARLESRRQRGMGDGQVDTSRISFGEMVAAVSGAALIFIMFLPTGSASAPSSADSRRATAPTRGSGCPSSTSCSS